MACESLRFENNMNTQDLFRFSFLFFALSIPISQPPSKPGLLLFLQAIYQFATLLSHLSTAMGNAHLNH